MTNELDRRDFVKTMLGSLAVGTLDWERLPRAKGTPADTDSFDAVVIGSGLGGLSCAAAFARQGFKALVLEQHSKAGGYATTFKRPGGFEFDVSLHSTGVGERNGVHNLIPGFPEIKDVEFVPHPTLYRAIFPEYDLAVPNCDVPGFVALLKKSFASEAGGIDALFQEMKQAHEESGRFWASKGQVLPEEFPSKYPALAHYAESTWGQILDAHLKDPKLKAVVSAQWAYYGLPPSKLASVYYGLPFYSYLSGGGFYPKGRSQNISNAMVAFIEEHGGKVQLNTRVEKILVREGKAYGVRSASGQEYQGRVVVSNANAYDTFHSLVDADEQVKDYLAQLDSYSPSLSSFQVFLGLKSDLVHHLGIKDTEIFYNPSYDVETMYEAARVANLSNPHVSVMVYDNLFPGYSPQGKNIVNILTLQGYEHWKPFEADYRKGNKQAYKAEKTRMGDLLIEQAEKKLLPGLSKAIEVKEIGTPLTNWRYTANYQGAIYGWDQTMNNSMPRRVGHETPIKNLYLSGAWTRPGGGYGAVIPSGLECFGDIMKQWS